jgi:cyclophilin family peptidyl-prolyl cis-trans isomerase
MMGVGRPLALLAAVTLACSGQETNTAGAPRASEPLVEKPQVVLETNKGRIVVELEPIRAPEAVQNFLLHVRSRFYDGLTFHRVRKDFVIQAGLLSENMQRRQTSVMGIMNEANNGLKNVRGAVAMARTTDPHSATSEFFINVKDNATLDFRDETYQGWGYAVFGRVVEGMEVVDAIAAVPVKRTATHEALPVDPVVIHQAYVASPKEG